MIKFEGVLLATDYDDTFYSEEFGIAPENRAAVEYFISRGGRFVISTGRSLENFVIQIKREKLPMHCPAILSNGAIIYDFSKNRVLYARTMRPEVIEDMQALCRQFPEIGFEAYVGKRVYIHRPNKITRCHLSRAGLHGIECPVEAMPTPWIKAIVQHEDPALLIEVQAYLRGRWPGAYEAIFSNENLLELTAKGSHKGSALLWLADYLGVSREHIYAVGNGENDLPMLSVAQKGFAPANGAQCLHARGAKLSPNCEDGCVAHVVEWLDEQYGRRP